MFCRPVTDVSADNPVGSPNLWTEVGAPGVDTARVQGHVTVASCTNNESATNQCTYS